MKIYVLNGPNLNLLGIREPEVYGTRTLDEVESRCRVLAEDAGAKLEWRQTNSEAEMIGWIQEAASQAEGLIINPAAFTHYSLAVREALGMCEIPVIELHISNIYAREPWRAHSVVSGAATGVIVGLGVHGYEIAISAMTKLIGG